jgi:hypothetical protein
MRYSEWYPSEIKPTHVGVYQRVISGLQVEIVYSLWDGKDWMAGSLFVDNAATCGRKSIFKSFEWRGVLRDTNGELLK